MPVPVYHVAETMPHNMFCFTLYDQHNHTVRFLKVKGANRGGINRLGPKVTTTKTLVRSNISVKLERASQAKDETRLKTAKGPDWQSRNKTNTTWRWG